MMSAKNPKIEEINRRNKEFWRDAQAQFEARINDLPGDARRAVRRYDEDMKKVAAGAMDIKAIPSLEYEVAELERIEKEQSSERQTMRAKKPRTAKTEKPITAFIKTLIKRRPDASPAEILASVYREARDATEGAGFEKYEDGVVSTDSYESGPKKGKPIQLLNERSLRSEISRLRKKKDLTLTGYR